MDYAGEKIGVCRIQLNSDNSVARQNVPIISIDTDFIPSWWIDFSDSQPPIGREEMLWMSFFLVAEFTGTVVTCEIYSNNIPVFWYLSDLVYFYRPRT